MNDINDALITMYLIGAIMALGLTVFLFFVTKDKK